MPADNELWIPPLLPKDQKRINSYQKYQSLVKWTGFPGKTLWDWLQFLAALAIPVVIAAGTLWFSARQSEASSKASERQHQTDLQIAKDQQEENALQMYLEQMLDLLLNNKLGESQPGDAVRNIARARTLTVLSHLNGTRKREIVLFLQDTGLIDRKNTIIDLADAELSNTDLSEAKLNNINFSETNLLKADLRFAELYRVDLHGAELYRANLIAAHLSHADLHGADLDYALQLHI